MITDEMVERAARAWFEAESANRSAKPLPWDSPLLAKARDRQRQLARVALEAALPAGQPTPYRLSPDGVLARRISGGWVVRDAPGRSHYVGQHLTDQAVAGWSPLIRKGPSNVG
ncbi:hypothetical protein [Actinophytocola sediminis]